MDKSIEIVLIVTVLFVTALIVVSMVNSEADGFMSFMSDQSSDAKCSLWVEQDSSERPEEACEECDSLTSGDCEGTNTNSNDNNNNDPYTGPGPHGGGSAVIVQ